RRRVGLGLVRFHWRKTPFSNIFRGENTEVLSTHTKKPWAALAPRPTAFSQVKEWKQKEKPQAKPFRITHGLSM
ncbi:MAG TPA: hypothetical protein VFK47_10445, partial [Ktedonobacteraceae bacterium]|nr:hypothetical protein [Ktedonobacteraceae bacterium]